MVGLIGTVGGAPTDLEGPLERLAWTGREVTDVGVDGSLAVATSLHPTFAAEQPARAGDSSRIWVWGAPRGIHGPDGYEPRDAPPHAAPASYFADLYDRFGPDFVDRVNGSFAGVLREPGGAVRLFTDRLGTRPLYHARAPDGRLAFATSVQSLAAHPAVEATFDEAAAVEYLALRRITGTRTALAGVRTVPPATVATVRDDGTLAERTYWWPVADPSSASFDELVERFRTTFERVVDEQVADHREYGLLLSGGSDSRYLLSAMESPRAFHATGWMSREARIAERCAAVVDAPFELLEREPDHQARALERTPAMMNHYGSFDQAHLALFADELADAVDVVTTGLYADVLFGGYELAEQTLGLGPLGTLHLPIEDTVDSVEEYVDDLAADPPAYVDSEHALGDVLSRGIRRTEWGIEAQGVPYPSLRELVSLGTVYPLTNDPDLFYWGLLQAGPTYTPFLDDRLVDLALRIPVEHTLRDDVVRGALRRSDPALATIPHASTGVPPAASFPRNVVGHHANDLRRRLVPPASAPRPGESHGPWMDDAALLRDNPFVLEALVAHRDRIEAIPFLDWDGALECYNDHLAGADNVASLYALVSFLSMPMLEDVQRLADGGARESATNGSSAERTAGGSARKRTTDRSSEERTTDGSTRERTADEASGSGRVRDATLASGRGTRGGVDSR